MKADAKTQEYFSGRVKQVFVYITSRCQLRCKQCLYKPLLNNNSLDIDFILLQNLLTQFYNYGARKLSFLGGEPTLYFDTKSKKTFGDVLQMSKGIGYKLVRIDTNGQFDEDTLVNGWYGLLDEITFSVDGHNAMLNDAVRGKNTFSRCIKNITKAVQLGYNVQITSCVHRKSCPTPAIGMQNIHEMILFAQSLGVNTINFHPIIRSGIARDSWIEDTDIDPLTWVAIYNHIKENIANGIYQIHVRIPMRFEQTSILEKNKDKYFYCPLHLGERALIMPDGQIKVCAFTIGTERCIARYTSEGIRFEQKDNEAFSLSEPPQGVCYNQVGLEHLTPLCMSFKPDQDEFVWNLLKSSV